MKRSRQRKTHVHIRHAFNGGEYHVPGTNYRCDGFVENPQGKGTIYEFYGKTCYPAWQNFDIELIPPFPLTEGEGAVAAAANLVLKTYFILLNVCCVYHGCTDCFQQDRSDVNHPSTNQTLDELFKMTKKQERELKELGYSLVIVMEHQFQYQLKKNPLNCNNISLDWICKTDVIPVTVSSAGALMP